MARVGQQSTLYSESECGILTGYGWAGGRNGGWLRAIAADAGGSAEALEENDRVLRAGGGYCQEVEQQGGRMARGSGYEAARQGYAGWGKHAGVGVVWCIEDDRQLELEEPAAAAEPRGVE